jgi:hypothetical protein
VRDLRLFEAANQLIHDDRGRVELLAESNGALLASIEVHRGNELFRLGLWTADVLRGLRGLDGRLPAPLFVQAQRISELGRISASDRNAEWQRLRDLPAEGLHRVCSLFLRLATDTGTPVERRFCDSFLLTSSQLRPSRRMELCHGRSSRSAGTRERVTS